MTPQNIIDIITRVFADKFSQMEREGVLATTEAENWKVAGKMTAAADLYETLNSEIKKSVYA